MIPLDNPLTLVIPFIKGLSCGVIIGTGINLITYSSITPLLILHAAGFFIIGIGIFLLAKALTP